MDVGILLNQENSWKDTHEPQEVRVNTPWNTATGEEPILTYSIMQMVIDMRSGNQTDQNPGKKETKTRLRGKQGGVLRLRKNRLVRNRQGQPRAARPKNITLKDSLSVQSRV